MRRAKLRREAAELDRRRRLVLEDYSAAPRATRRRATCWALDLIDGQATDLARRVTNAEAELSEWEEAREDEALALLRGLVDVVHGRVAHAQGTAALQDALASVLAGIWLSHDGDRLRAEFRMAEHATAPSEAERQRIAYLFQHMEPGDPLDPNWDEGRFELAGQPRHTPSCRSRR